MHSLGVGEPLAKAVRPTASLMSCRPVNNASRAVAWKGLLADCLAQAASLTCQ